MPFAVLTPIPDREIPREVVGSLPKVFKQLKTDLPGIIANLKDRDITDICVAEVVALYDHHATQSQLAQQLRRERNLITETLKTPQGRLDSSVKEKVTLPSLSAFLLICPTLFPGSCLSLLRKDFSDILIRQRISEKK